MKLSIQKKKLKSLSKSQAIMKEQTPVVAGGTFNTTGPGSTCQNSTACPSRDRPDTCVKVSKEISCLIGHSCLC
ncbi:hypothetical protein N473_16300 [Pseudoalteromonas luteoviolacea CPMOR-1]|uniref:Uncharacterized protein n=1 Tax=Pseudoalteromonas luteoviolacea CPMOR-1 TaxID=1365248 RepID=A0A167L307_9GAMM|nr:hypothetical protein [Pseudoalteromonas luteoviolacea]KZN63725.1 hypothetical protein N473_16300 [Pseudoalteromonas luteoviolacea CPMOR-1]